MGSEINNNTQMYIEAELIKKVDISDIISEFMLNLENYAKQEILYDEYINKLENPDTNDINKNMPNYADTFDKKLDIENKDIIGIIIISDDSIDILHNYIKIRLNEID